MFAALSGRLPPLRAIVAAGLALASYLVTTVWKGDINDQIEKYANQNSRILAVETRFNDLPGFEAYSHSLRESIELQRLGIHILNKTINKADPDSFPVLELDKNLPRERVFGGQKVALEELLSGLNDVATMSFPVGPEMFPFASDWWKKNTTPIVMACIGIAPVADVEKGDEYSKTLSSIYAKEAAKHPEIDDGFENFRQALVAQVTRLDVGDAAMAAIGNPASMFDRNVPRIDPFGPDAKVLEQNYKDRKKWALGCIEATKESTFAITANYLRQMRSAAIERKLTPLNAEKRKVEDLEIFLYVLSGLIALFARSSAREA